MRVASARPIRRIVWWSLGLAFVTLLLAFCVVAANIHSGSPFLIGRCIEISLLWPALLLGHIDLLAGPPGFILMLLLAFAGYSALYFALVMTARWTRAILGSVMKRMGAG